MLFSLAAISVGAFLVPNLSHAALTTDYATYTAPAVVNYTTSDSSDGAALYLNMGSGPVCYIHPIGASGEVFSDFSYAGSCTSQASVTGNYQIVEPSSAGCNSLSYSACIAANTGNYLEADFTITSGGGSSSTITAGYENYADTCTGIGTSTTVCYDPLKAEIGIFLWIFGFFSIVWIVHRWFE